MGLAGAQPSDFGCGCAALDFGAGAFNGGNYWLEIAVRTNGAGFYTSLHPLQPVTLAPYAIFSGTASSALNSGYTNSVTGSHGTVGGGAKNTAGQNATVGGGSGNGLVLCLLPMRRWGVSPRGIRATGTEPDAGGFIPRSELAAGGL